MPAAARRSFEGAARADAVCSPGTAKTILVWGLLWLAFGARIEFSFTPELAFALGLTLLVPLATAWGVSRIGPAVILPIALSTLLPSVGWSPSSEFSVQFASIPMDLALLGVLGCGILAARGAPETWLPLVYPSRAWLVVPAVALLSVGRAEWPVARLASIWLDPAGGIAAALLACIVDWRALAAATPRARRSAQAVRIVLPVLLVASLGVAGGVNIEGFSLSWGSTGTRTLMPVACLLALLAGGQRLRLWLAVLLPLLALEALRTLADLPALADLLTEAKTLTWPRSIYALAAEAGDAGSAALIGWALATALGRRAPHSSRWLWLPAVGLLHFGVVQLMEMLLWSSAVRFYAISASGLIVGAVGFVAALMAGARGLVAAPLLLATATSLVFVATDGDLDTPAVLVEAATVAAVAALWGFFGWCTHRLATEAPSTGSSEPGMIDITRLAALVNRLDTSATLRSFGVLLVVLGVALVLFVMDAFGAVMRSFTSSEGFDLEFEEVAPVVAAMTFFVLAPLTFIVNDAIQRRDGARPLSALSGAVLAALGLALAGALVGGFAAVPDELVGGESVRQAVVLVTLVAILAMSAALLTTSSRRIAAAMAAMLLLLLAAVVALVLLATQSPDRDNEYDASSVLPMLLVGAVSMVLLVRGVRLRADLVRTVPRGLLFGEIDGGSFWARLACLMGMPASMWRREALLTPSFWAFLLSRPLVYGGALSLWQGRPVLGLCCIVGGHAAFAGGKRLAARAIWQAGAVHRTPPVLFLRSFEDDQFELGRRSRDPIRRWLALWAFRRNLDEMLVDEVARYGRVVALGRPGETRIPFGAARYYATHDDWRRIITATAQSARAIVIVAGETPGVREEYRMIVEQGLLDRTVLIFRPGAEAQAGNRAALAAFARAGGSVPDLPETGSGSLVALLRLRGEPVLITAESPDAATYVAVLRAHFQRRDKTGLQIAARESPDPWWSASGWLAAR